MFSKNRIDGPMKDLAQFILAAPHDTRYDDPEVCEAADQLADAVVDPTSRAAQIIAKRRARRAGLKLTSPSARRRALKAQVSR